MARTPGQFIFRASFLALSGWAAYVLFYTSKQNGLFEHGWSIQNSNRLHTGEKLRRHYTGVDPVDRFLTTLVAFFWSWLDTSRPASQKLLGDYFAAQIFGASVLLWMEGARARFRPTLLALPMLFSLLYQSFSFAVVIPLYLALLAGDAGPYRVPSHKALAIPPAVLIGFGVPTYIMVSLDKFNFSADQKQAVIAVWQIFPVFITIAFYVLSGLFKSNKTRQQEHATSASNSALAYNIAGAVAILAQVVLAVKLYQSGDPLETFKQCFAPRWDIPRQDLLSLAHNFFLWDCLCALMAMSLWALMIAQQAKVGLVNILLHIVILGPVTAVGYAYKKRDARVYSKIN